MLTGHLLRHQRSIFRRFLSQKPQNISVTFIDGSESKTVTGEQGTDLMRLAHANNVDLEGACEGSLACSTCHVILPPKIYQKLDEASDEENDMLDLAFGLTETSRLGCQVKLEPFMEGCSIRIPQATRNISHHSKS